VAYQIAGAVVIDGALLAGGRQRRGTVGLESCQLVVV